MLVDFICNKKENIDFKTLHLNFIEKKLSLSGYRTNIAIGLWSSNYQWTTSDIPIDIVSSKMYQNQMGDFKLFSVFFSAF